MKRKRPARKRNPKKPDQAIELATQTYLMRAKQGEATAKDSKNLVRAVWNRYKSLSFPKKILFLTFALLLSPALLLGLVWSRLRRKKQPDVVVGGGGRIVSDARDKADAANRQAEGEFIQKTSEGLQSQPKTTDDLASMLDRESEKR